MHSESGRWYQFDHRSLHVFVQATLKAADTAAARAVSTAGLAADRTRCQTSAQLAVLLVAVQLITDLTAAVRRASAAYVQVSMQQPKLLGSRRWSCAWCPNARHDRGERRLQEPRQQLRDEIGEIAGLVHLSPAEVQDLLCPVTERNGASTSRASSLLEQWRMHGRDIESQDELQRIQAALEDDVGSAIATLGRLEQNSSC